jgi:adenosylmethionine-8-amino-7-oxononanoate aminotransferase
MSISERSLFTAPFKDFLFDVIFIDVPDEGIEQVTFDQLDLILRNGNDIAAFIFEPLLLGTAGMRMYKPGILNELIKRCRQAGIISIADEVMTGFGRTGKMFAMEYVPEPADIICLSKGITGGVFPLGVTAVAEHVYNQFLNDDRSKTFFHGHSYTGNPLACAAANASLDLFNDSVLERIKSIGNSHAEFVSGLNKKGFSKRISGTVLALEFDVSDSGYISGFRDNAYNFFLGEGVLIRPLGNVIYVMPPYCITDKELNKVYDAIRKFIDRL